MNKSEEYIIEASGSWVRIPFRDLLHYSDLLFLMVRRDFVSRYKQTILGPLWFIIQPLLTSVVFVVIFSKVAGVSTDGLPAFLFYLCGMLGWQYFAQCMQGTSATFINNAGLFGKVYFPRLIVPLSVILSNLIAFGIQLATFLSFWVYFKFCTAAGNSFHLSGGVILFPLLIVQSACIGLGVGLWLSALTAKYRDFVHLSGFLTQLWLYATPVVYPLAQVPEQWRWLISLNPLTGIVESFKYMFLGRGVVDPAYLLISAGMTAFVLVTGVIIFSRTERTFIDTV